MGTTYAPDCYELVNGTWGTDADYETGSGGLTGDGYIEFKGTTPASDPAIWYDDYIPVVEGQPYSCTAGLYAANNTNYMQVGINWYQHDLSACGTASSTLFNSTLTTPTTWETHGGIVDAPSTAKYAKPWVVKENANFTASIDRIDFKYTPVAFDAYRWTSAQNIITATTVKLEFNKENYDYGSWYDHATNHNATVPCDGVYHIRAAVRLYYGGANFPQGNLARMYYYKNAAQQYSLDERVLPTTQGNYMLIGSTVAVLNSGDTVDIRVAHSEGVTLTANLTSTRFAMVKVE